MKFNTDAHDELVIAFIEYIKANEWWEEKRSARGYNKAGAAIRKVRNLAEARRKDMLTRYQAGEGRTKQKKAPPKFIQEQRQKQEQQKNQDQDPKQ